MVTIGLLGDPGGHFMVRHGFAQIARIYRCVRLFVRHIMHVANKADARAVRDRLPAGAAARGV
jgi:hypothetical protein